MTVRPNFFMIGAPKCGTTAMCEYLRTHPKVFMYAEREPHFFSSDTALSNCRTMDEYIGLFAGAGPEHVVVGEKSATYMFSDTAVSRIREFRPDAHVLVMLRRPSDLVYAFQGTLLRSGVESEWDFERAWNLQHQRAMGKSVPPTFGRLPATHLNYKWVGSLGSQVERVLGIFPRQQVHFILFEDFLRDTRSEYLRLLEFLMIPDDGRVEFPKLNEAVQFKSRWLARLPRYLRVKGWDRIQMVKKALGIRQLGVVRAFDYFNAETRPRPPLRPEFRQHLNEVFRDEVLKLESLLGRDLSSWRS